MRLAPLVPKPATQDSSESLKVIVFTIAGYRLALPLDGVVRVVNCPLELHTASGIVELFQLGQHTITVLNLHRHLALKQASQNEAAGHFLVVTRTSQAELCAIRVDAPPDLVDLLPSTLRKLPDAYRQGHPLNIASRVAVLPQGKSTAAIFVLDMKRVLDTIVVDK